MAASDRVTIVIRGPGGHAARPHQTVDPVMVACSLGMALQTIVSRNIDPIQTAVLTIGAISAGDVANVIPRSAKMLLSVRSFSPEIRSQLETRIRDLVEAHARGYGAEVEINYIRGYPVIVNSEAETRFAEEVIREVVGADNLAECAMLPGSEDFAYYLEHKNGAFLRLGNGLRSATLHNPEYDFCDDSLVAGAAVWARLAERYLQA
jgi:hippurate hydrolase